MSRFHRKNVIRQMSLVCDKPDIFFRVLEGREHVKSVDLKLMCAVSVAILRNFCLCQSIVCRSWRGCVSLEKAKKNYTLTEDGNFQVSPLLRVPTKQRG